MPSNSRDRRSRERLVVRDKELRALEMRLGGASLPDIAKQLGYAHRSSVSKAIKRVMSERQQEGVDELRQMECARLDRMLTALWPQALQGRWLAVDRVLKLMERKAALLGLDAPQRRIVEVITPDVLMEALANREKEIKELEAAEAKADAVEAFDLDDDDSEEITEAVVVHARAGSEEEDGQTGTA